MEINQFCETMQCDYVEASVLEDNGIEVLMEKVILKSMELQELLEQEELKINKDSKSPNKDFKLGDDQSRKIPSSISKI